MHFGFFVVAAARSSREDRQSIARWEAFYIYDSKVGAWG